MRRAKPGIAYVVEHTRVPVVPVGILGASDDFLKRGLRFERPVIGMRVGKAFNLPASRGAAMTAAHPVSAMPIWSCAALAELLPPEYHGVYAVEGSLHTPKPLSTCGAGAYAAAAVDLASPHVSRLVRLLARLLIRVLTRAELRGLEHLPRGASCVRDESCGDADAPLLLTPLRPRRGPRKIELLFEFPVLGRLMDWYGIIWLHRGRVDRRALEFADQALRQGRSLVIAPEGRYTLTGALEPRHRGRGLRGPARPCAHHSYRVTGTQMKRSIPACAGCVGPSSH